MNSQLCCSVQSRQNHIQHVKAAKVKINIAIRHKNAVSQDTLNFMQEFSFSLKSRNNKQATRPKNTCQSRVKPDCEQAIASKAALVSKPSTGNIELFFQSSGRVNVQPHTAASKHSQRKACRVPCLLFAADNMLCYVCICSGSQSERV